MPIKIFEIGPFALVSAVYKRNRDGKKSAVTIPARADQKPNYKTGAYCADLDCKGELALADDRPVKYANWLNDGAFKIALICKSCNKKYWSRAMLLGVKEESNK